MEENEISKILLDAAITVHGYRSAVPLCLCASVLKSSDTASRNLEDKGVIKNGKFAKDCSFKSPSSAAAVVLGRSACDGLTAWRSDEDDLPIKEHIQKKESRQC